MRLSLIIYQVQKKLYSRDNKFPEVESYSEISIRELLKWVKHVLWYKTKGITAFSCSQIQAFGQTTTAFWSLKLGASMVRASGLTRDVMRSCLFLRASLDGGPVRRISSKFLTGR